MMLLSLDSFITAGSCGDMECDAEKKLLIHDVDGSFTQSSGSVWIIPQSERNWDVPGQEHRGIGDFRIPSVQQTTIDGERIPYDHIRTHKGTLLRSYVCHKKRTQL